ncbi:MAG: radical SAM protein [Candidatus Lokiarchaeota archaeon]|nr:radical SAM protein [Candidatus Lokiarchaeota archaeon]
MVNENEGNLAYGPVPSRRLGRSLGINNIPAKHCPYSCVYCQVGKNTSHSPARRAFYDPDRVFEAVKEKVDVARSRGERVDYLAFVPDGEPTLDVNLGVEVASVKRLGVPVAVITNASILSQPGVPEGLKEVDLVSLKVDACTEKTWRKVNRPCKGLGLGTILEGITRFASSFGGSIITETMILDSIEYDGELGAIAAYIGAIPGVEKAYISTPTRPPMERWVGPTSPAVLEAATDAFEAVLGNKRVEVMNQYEGNAFSCTGKLEESLLDIVAVHPMREEAAVEFLAKGGAGPERLDALVTEGKLKRKQYQGHVYFVKRHGPDRPS